MASWASLIPALLVVAPFSGAAIAGECVQSKAIYQDRGKVYEIRFSPATSEAGATSHTFTLKLLKGGMVMDGVVLPADGSQRANGLLMYKCPDGDVTGADLAKCTVWDGVFYGIAADGAVVDLPEASANAAEQLILSDFSRQAQNSPVWADKKIADIPADVLTLEGCGS